MTQNFSECYEILSNMYDEVDGEAFYRYIFPDNENSNEKHMDYSTPNALYLYKHHEDDGIKCRLRRRVMYNDTWQQDYMTYVEGNEMTLCSGLCYRGNTNSLEKAQRMNALIFDLDGVGRNELLSLFMRTEVPAEHFRSVPLPTFIVLSGNGLHLYYVFDKPIDLYPNIKLQLKALKYDLTFRIWEYKGTSQVKSIQYQSIVQGFRMVGSINNKYGNTITAFKVGEKVSLDYINAYAKPENRVDITRSFRPSKVDRKTAKELYPEWYQRVVVEGNKRPKKWDIAGKVHGDNPYALYDWWKRQIGSIKGGHRYFFLMCLVIYACKCDVPEEKLRADMQKMFEELKKIKHENPFTQEDVKSSMECYSKEYYNFTIDDIELLTDIRIEKNKRNGRKQADHIKLMNFVRDELNHNTDWRNKDGRPEKKMLVWEWRQAHPDGRKVDCQRDTGLSKHTVLKWWDYVPPTKVLIDNLTESEQQYYSQKVVSDVKKIARDRGISEEDAYKVYQNMSGSVILKSSKTYALQKKLESSIFAESEITPEFRRKAEEKGLDLSRLTIVPDDQYEAALCESALIEMRQQGLIR